ncbi:MAG: hypothetical protein HUU38_21825 [Anaerolineales bacterium]|nr:hypothetical protein [Anaerolineales bacterium]
MLTILDNGLVVKDTLFSHLWFQVRDPYRGEYFRAITLRELTALIVDDQELADYNILGKQWGTMRGAYGAGVDYVYMATGIFSPEHVGVVQFYGAAGEGHSLDEATLRAHTHLGAVEATLANLQQSQTRPPLIQWMEWYLEFVTQRAQNVMAILGHPDPREDRGSLGKDGALATEGAGDLAQEQNELLFRGLAKLREDFVFQVTADYLSQRTLTQRAIRAAQVVSNVASRRRGALSIGVSLSIPLAAALSNSVSGSHSTTGSQSHSVSEGVSHGEGTSHTDSYSHGTNSSWSVSESETHGISVTHTDSEGVAKSLTHSTGTSDTESTSHTDSHSQGVSDSVARSASTTTSHSVANSSGGSQSSSSNWSQGGSSSWGQGTSEGTTTGTSTNQSTSQGVSSGTTTGTGTSEASSSGTSTGTNSSASQNTNWAEGSNWGVNGSVNGGVNGSVGVPGGASVGASGGATVGGSYGQNSSTGGGSGTSTGTSSGTSNSTSTSTSTNQSNSTSINTSTSTGTGTSNSSSQGSNQSVGGSTSWGSGGGSSSSTSWGTTVTNGTAKTNGTTVTHGTNESWGTADMQGQALSVSEGVASGLTTNVGSAVSVSESYATGMTKSYGGGVSDTWGKADGTSEEWSRSHGEADAFGLALGRNGGSGFTGGFSSGLVPGVNLSRSWQMEDRVADRLTEVLEQLAGQLNQASAEGGFLTEALLLTASPRAATAGAALAPQAFHGPLSVPTPVLTVQPEATEAADLRQHALAFVTHPMTDPDDLFDALGGKYSTLLTAKQVAAYTAPAIFREGTLRVLPAIPKTMGFYPDMPGEVLLGHQYSPETADLTTAKVTLDKARLMHTLFTGATGFGKSVAAAVRVRKILLPHSGLCYTHPIVQTLYFFWRLIMVNKIQAWTAYGPRLEPASPMTSEELIENIIQATNQSRGSVLAMLAELDVQLENGLKAGRVVQLPNGTHFRPVGKKDGTVNIEVRVNPSVKKRVNAEFRGKWRNAEFIGKSEAEVIAKWNEEHPTEQIS